MLTRTQLLSVKAPYQDVQLADGTVRVAALSVNRRLKLLDDYNDYTARLAAYQADQALPESERVGLEAVQEIDASIITLIYAIVDEDDNPILTLADAPAFMDLDYKTITKLSEAFAELNVTPVASAVDAKKKSSK